MLLVACNSIEVAAIRDLTEQANVPVMGVIEPGVRAALRAQPFDLDALKAAMAEMRAARQTFDRRIHDFIAQQASEMSPAGRQKLADRPSARRDAGTGQPPRN